MVQVRSLRAVYPAIAKSSLLSFVAIAGLVAVSSPAFAHHPFGGETPGNAMQGFLSGLGHPVIGLDHLAFVITAGLLAAAVGRGLIIPISFVLASVAGTVIHLMALNLPVPELVISASVLLFGVLLAMKRQPHIGLTAGLAALAGIYHGFAYGEAVVGADMASIFAYLLGFAMVQTVISVLACLLAERLVNRQGEALGLRFAGFTLAGIGAAFLSGVVLG